MSETVETPAADPAAKTARRVRVPGGAAPAAEPAAAVVSLEAAEPGEDLRTPGLTLNEDGSITYAGTTHRKPFWTPHGMVVPPSSVEAPGLAGRR